MSRSEPVDILTEAPAHLEKVLSTLQELQKRLDAEMNSGLASSAGAGVNPQHVRMAVQLTKATSDLGREARAWTKKVRELASTATLEERSEAVVMFIRSLPPGARSQILRKIQE